MNEFEIITHLMMTNNISYTDLSKGLGQQNPGNIYNTINKNKNIYFSTFRKIMDKLGYEIVVRKKKKTDKDSEYIVNDTFTPSHLRFHDMDLSLEAIFGGNTSNET